MTATANFVRPRNRRPEHLEGQMIVKVRPDAVRPAMTGDHLTFSAVRPNALPAQLADPLRSLRSSSGLQEVSALFSNRWHGLKRFQAGPATEQAVNLVSSVVDSDSEELAGVSMISLDPKRIDTKLMRDLASSDAIEFVEPMPARWLCARRSKPDPMRNLQWGLRAIRLFEASTVSASRLSVAVLDTGIDADHPDLENVVDHYQHTGLKAEDLVGHGTHVAGIIAAETNNGIGVTGVARCRIKAWKIFADKPHPVWGFIVDGQRYLQALNEVVAARVSVVNLSIGGTASSQVEALLFQRLEREGISVVAAMGNEYEEGNPVEYPGAYDGVLAVGAIAENLRRSPFSNTGSHIDLVAPGSNILSTLPTYGSTIAQRSETDYAAWSGTSMATPHVAAAACLLKMKNPSLDAPAIKQRLKATATRLRAMRKASTPSYGSGLLNLQHALS